MTKTVSKNKNTEVNNHSIWKRSFALLQRLGKSLLFPIAMLPIAAIFLRIGAAIPGDTDFSIFVGSLFQTIGNAVFGTALPFIFAIGVAFGLSKDQRGEAAIVGFAVMVLLYILLSRGGAFGGQDFVHQIYKGITLEGQAGFIGVFGEKAYNSILAGNIFTAIFVGSMVAFIYNRFNGIEMPSVLGFFSGRRLVPVLAILSMVVVGLVWAIIFPWIGVGLFYIGKGMGEAQGNRWANASIMAGFGLMNRLLIPFGLHHTINTPVWFTQIGGSHIDVAGVPVDGDIYIFAQGAAEGNTSGTFQAGFFPVMMFGLPALALAFYFNADNKEQKGKVASVFVGASLVSFFTGITEPIEFAFLFLAPGIFALHAVLTALSGFIVGLFGIQLGFGFSAGLIDYVLSIPKSLSIIDANKSGIDAVMANPAWIWVIGAFIGAAYFFSTTLLVKKFNLSLPGRGTGQILTRTQESKEEEEEKSSTSEKPKNKYYEDAKTILEAVGGQVNIKQLTNCATRLRFQLKDNSKVDADAIKQTKAIGQVKVAGGYQVIMGPTVELYANEIHDQMKSK